QRQVVGEHPHAAGGFVAIRLGPPAPARRQGAPVPVLAAVVVAVGQQVAVAAVGGDVAGVAQLRLAMHRVQHQQRAVGAGGGPDHRAQGGGQFVRIQGGGGHQVGQAGG